MMLQSDKILILVGCTVSTLLFAVTTTGEEWIKRKPLQTTHIERLAKNDSQTVANTERYFIFNSTNINYENTNSSYNINHINKIINNKQNDKRSMKRNGNEPFTVDYYGIWRFCFKKLDRVARNRYFFQLANPDQTSFGKLSKTNEFIDSF